jgi:hypothetical protein
MSDRALGARALRWRRGELLRGAHAVQGGVGVPADAAKASELLAKACTAGLAPACPLVQKRPERSRTCLAERRPRSEGGRTW